jgi:sigma-B regulation protein RsbU (phosphoserine phosphatase)
MEGPDVEPLPLHQLELTAESSGHHRALIIMLDDSVPTSLFTTVLAAAEELQVAVIVLGTATQGQADVAAHAGAMLLPVDTPSTTIAAILFGMLHRQSAMDRMRDDLEIASRFQGGLRGEITKIHEELQLAALVQRQFLPHQLPKMHGIEFAVLWRPANYIAGDIYQIDRLDDDHVGIFLADAVGHGVPAALMTMAITQSLTMTTRIGRKPSHMQPSEVLACINAEMIERQDHHARFATGVYAIVNCKRRTLTLAGAGHPPPMLIHADGTSTPLETTGGLLGIFPDETYSQIEVPFELGDRLMIYSDGFEQAFPESTNSNYERRLPNNRYLSEFGELSRLDTPEEVVDSLATRLDAEMGSLHQIDDLTLICMLAGPAMPTPSNTNADKLRV